MAFSFLPTSSLSSPNPAAHQEALSHSYLRVKNLFFSGTWAPNPNFAFHFISPCNSSSRNLIIHDFYGIATNLCLHAWFLFWFLHSTKRQDFKIKQLLAWVPNFHSLVLSCWPRGWSSLSSKVLLSKRGTWSEVPLWELFWGLRFESSILGTVHWVNFISYYFQLLVYILMWLSHYRLKLKIWKTKW